MPWSPDVPASLEWLSGFIYFGTLVTVMLLLFRKSRLDKIEVSQKQIDRCRTILPVYLALCIALLFVLLVRSGIEKGKIDF